MIGVLDVEAPARNPLAAGLVGLRSQGAEGIAHEHRPGAVRDASRMSIARDLQILPREIVRVEPGIDAGPVTKLAPWGVQLSGSFSKAAALASFAHLFGPHLDDADDSADPADAIDASASGPPSE